MTDQQLKALFPSAKIGRWTLGSSYKFDGRTFWVCTCRCGTQKCLRESSLTNGDSKSCGCLHKENVSRQFTKHSRHGTTEYNIWRSMRARCNNPNSHAWKYYGARGIKVCDRWNKSFPSFLSDMGARPSGKSIDRINNDGNYELSNCRWSTPAEQNKNKRKQGQTCKTKN